MSFSQEGSHATGVVYALDRVDVCRSRDDGSSCIHIKQSIRVRKLLPSSWIATRQNSAKYRASCYMQSFQDRSVYCLLVDPLESCPFGGLDSIADLSYITETHPTPHGLLYSLPDVSLILPILVSPICCRQCSLEFSFLTLLP